MIPLSEAIISTIFMLIPFTIAILFAGSLPPLTAVTMTSVSVVLTFLALCQIGVIITSALLLLKNVSSLMSIFNFLLQIATGMLIPVQFLPEPFKVLAFAIPSTHGIDLARHFILGTTTIWPAEVELGVLVALLAVFGVLAGFATSYLERKAKVEGLSMA